MRVISLVLSLVIVLSLCSCGKADKASYGSGQEGVVEDIHWEEFDGLLDKSMAELDIDKRAMLLHQAEDKLLGEGFMIPLFFSTKSYLVKRYVEGAYLQGNGNTVLTRAYRKDGEKSISVCEASEPENLDPAGKSSSNVTTIGLQIHAGLTRVNANGDNVPDLCESYQVSEDGRTYTFVMRDNLKWSDGSKLDAKDFEYSWKRASNVKNGLEYTPLFDVLKGYPNNVDVKASDDGKIFTVNLTNPCVYFLTLCSFPPFSAVQQEAIESAEGYKNAQGKVVGPSAWAKDAGFVTSGPFTVKTWKHNEYIQLVKNPYYYAADEVKLDTINYMITTDSSSAYAAYQTNDIAVLNGLIPQDIIPTLMDDEDFHIKKGISSTAFEINPKSSIFEGMTREEAITFRRAIGYAIDRKFLVNVGLTGIETPATTYVRRDTGVGGNRKFGDTPGYSYPEGSGYYPEDQDLDTARELLKSIGFEFGDDGKLKDPIALEYIYNPASTNEAVAVCIQADLGMLGITIIPSSRDFNVYLGERKAGNYELARYAWAPDYDDPYGTLAEFRSSNQNNGLSLNK